MGTGLGIWLFLGAHVGLVVFSVGLGGAFGTWLYNRRWRRLQAEVFRRRAVAAWRRKLARWMQAMAGWVDPGARLGWAGSSFTIEKDVGLVWWTEGPSSLPGCPLWYLERDYILAHEQAERPV